MPKIKLNPPAVILSNIDFKFENLRLANDEFESNIESEERINGNGIETRYKLKLKPIQIKNKPSVRVEYPIGRFLTIEKDFTVDCTKEYISFHFAPDSKVGTLIVHYFIANKIKTLKRLKINALYSINIICTERSQSDSLAERVVKALLLSEEQFLDQGVKIEPIGGSLIEENGKNFTVQLKYTIEKEMSLEQTVQPIDQIKKIDPKARLLDN